uniref:Annexin n=1 Tax=Ciona savignyi TaxID=51511 RepID=H2Y7G1_CIOSA
MSYGYPPGSGQGYPPQQGAGYPGAQQGYPGAAPGGYPPAGAPGGYPPNAGGYPPAGGAPGGYPPAGGAPGSYPPQGGAPGGYPPQAGAPGGYPPAGGAGYPPQGGYPGAGAPPAAGGIAPAQNYAQPGGMPYGGGPPPQGQYGGYPQSSAPPSGQPGYGAPSAPPGQPYAGKMAKVTSGMAAMAIKTHGTVTPHPNFNAENDAKVLRKAMKGIGTDEKSIIDVIGHRSNKQRQEIRQMFKQAYGRDLIKDFKSEVSGNFEDLLCGLMLTPREYDAQSLYKAMDGIGTTESTLVEVLVSRTNQEIREIKEAYKRLYKQDLEKRLISETSGHFKKLLVSLNNGCRDESTHVDLNKARDDANKLYQAGEKKWGTDESTFNMIMASRSMPQLQATFEEYYKIANRDIIKSVKSEFSGSIEDGMVAVIEVARNPAAYFARRLYESMKGAGTKDHMLIRVVISRSEIDMVEIKRDFQAMYKIPLAKYVGDDTGGDYKKLLLAIIG